MKLGGRTKLGSQRPGPRRLARYGPVPAGLETTTWWRWRMKQWTARSLRTQQRPQAVRIICGVVWRGVVPVTDSVDEWRYISESNPRVLFGAHKIAKPGELASAQTRAGG